MHRYPVPSSQEFLGLFLCSLTRFIDLFYFFVFQQYQTHLCGLLFQMCNSKRNPIEILFRMVLNEMLLC